MLKDFIENNREAFDDKTPSNEIFNRVQSEINNRKPKTITLTRGQLVKIAASFILPIALSYFLMARYYEAKVDKLSAQITENQTVVNPMVSNLVESEQYYNNLVSQKTKEVYNALSNDAQLIQEIELALNDIDNSYKEINADFGENVNSEAVMSAMINCHRLKLQTLEDIYSQISQN